MMVAKGQFLVENSRDPIVFWWKNIPIQPFLDKSAVHWLPGLLVICQKSGIFWADTNYGMGING